MSDIIKLWSTKSKIQHLENQLLTGYKLTGQPDIDREIGSVPLTEQEKEDMMKEVEDLKKQLNP